jgi:1-acyl-sn-glycerol-3-phosphate acyltransferase
MPFSHSGAEHPPSRIQSARYFWRLGVLAVCFAAFGIGGIFFTLVVFPAMRLFSGGPHAHRRRARRLVHGCFATLVTVLRATGTMTLETRNAKILRDCRHKLVLANHPSYLDVVILLALMPDADCVVKEGLWQSRYFRGVVREAGYISNSDPHQLVAECAAAIVEHGPLLIFPEGTRSVPGQPLAFQRGAARIALRSGCEIVRVVITCEPPVWAKGFRLSEIARRSFRIKLKAESPVKLTELGVSGGEAEPLAARRLTRNLQHYFTEQIRTHERPASRDQAIDRRGAES